MMNSRTVVESLSSSDLLSATRELVQRARGVQEKLLVHLGEIDERKLYLDLAYPSMFVFCMKEFGFSEGGAYNRIMVARAARRLPAILEAVRSGQVHLAGLRVLAPHLTLENHGKLLAEAAGKSKREIEEIVARLSPQPPVATIVRKVPGGCDASTNAPLALSFDASPTTSSVATSPAAASATPPVPAPARDERRSVIAPLTEDTYKIQFTASRACRDKLRQAKDLLRHRIPDGDVGTIVEKALDLLIEQVKKERFAHGRKARCGPSKDTAESSSRHIPAAIQRAVFERDGCRCTFTDEQGRRCTETGALEFDHQDGFARTRVHRVDRIRLLCRAHNQHAAEQLYGRAFMERARATQEPLPGLPGILSG
jgi:5-methylcytosine-specific restriction endonuclease McrA